MKIGPYIRSDWNGWRYWWVMRKDVPLCGIFRNMPHILPGRWGIYIGGLEIGSRAPRDPVGVWLKKHGLWPW